ncbi:hypothetical protein WH50_25000 [Pokkaliibacter plantistimulans]|uniref:Uncharacterized protein n=1 Tax=Pokkaliibacter plantistimulans TaxID=1635171 RepID=A0ABX5LPU5_9GAMM|nr:hypothetical protein [Pokkaliibacter plantistimulans]PXF28684.1 hypothetical protein WH50_25000 [Pokkaliibacter plantistimulans]
MNISIRISIVKLNKGKSNPTEREVRIKKQIDLSKLAVVGKFLLRQLVTCAVTWVLKLFIDS